MSQLGPSVTTYVFNTNGTFRVSTSFELGGVPTMSATGTFRVVTNKVLLYGRGRTNTAEYTLDGDTLVIDEGRKKVFRLHRVRE
jgi:hypothetical protein